MFLLRQARAERLGSRRPGKIDGRAEWVDLAPVRRLDLQDRFGLPALEIVSVCRSGTPGLVRDHGHAFIRLLDAEGGVCPIGFFPDESTAIEPNLFPGLRMPGLLLVPDKYDLVAWNPLATRFPIAPATFARLKRHLEDLQRDRHAGSLGFDILDRSCVGFVVRIAALAGIGVAAEVRLSDFLGPSRLVRSLTRLVPHRLRRLAFNLGVGCRGGFCVYRGLWERSPAGAPVLRAVSGMEPLFPRWPDVAHRRVPFYHVRALRDWQRSVAAEGPGLTVPRVRDRPG